MTYLIFNVYHNFWLVPLVEVFVTKLVDPSSNLAMDIFFIEDPKLMMDILKKNIKLIKK